MEEQRQTTGISVKESNFDLTPVGQAVKNFEVMQRMAKMFTTSTIVPKQYADNVGNCVIAIDMATRMNVNPLMVMQNLYVVHGNPSWSSKFLIATINMSGKYTALRYEKRTIGMCKLPNGGEVENIECIAYATEIATGEVLKSDPVSIDMAIKEGWYTKQGSKWQTMPNLMLTYRAAAFWQRMYCPEISMGFLTHEEAIDIQDAEVVQPTAKGVDKLSKLAAEAAGVEIPDDAEPTYDNEYEE